MTVEPSGLGFDAERRADLFERNGDMLPIRTIDPEVAGLLRSSLEGGTA